MDIEYLEDFIEAAIQRGKALSVGNAKIANKNYDKIHKIRETWKNDPQMDLRVLEPLLNHENDYIKADIAFTLLNVSPQKAESVLEELALNERSEPGFEAKMILSEWRKGNLKP